MTSGVIAFPCVLGSGNVWVRGLGNQRVVGFYFIPTDVLTFSEHAALGEVTSGIVSSLLRTWWLLLLQGSLLQLTERQGEQEKLPPQPASTGSGPSHEFPPCNPMSTSQRAMHTCSKHL